LPRNIFGYFFLLATFFGLAGQAFCAPLPPQVEVLPNGARIIVATDHSLPLVAINLVVRAGSAYEEEGQSGTAHLLEHLLFCGSRNYPAGGVQKIIEDQGGSVNAGTLRDFTHLYAIVPTQGFEKTLAALGDALLYPALEEGEINRERGILLGEIVDQREDPQAVLWDMAFQALLPEHPYRHPVSGEIGSLLNLTREQLQRFHRRWYAPERISLIIVGDISREQALAAGKQLFDKLPSNTGGKTPAPAEGNSPPTNQEKYHNGALAFVGLAARGPGIASPREVCAMDVLLSLLEESKNSLLGQSLLGNPQVAFSTGGDFLTSRYPSPFLLWASCPPSRRAAVKNQMAQALERVASGEITSADLAAAKSSLLTAFWLSNETFSDRADVLGFYEALGDLQFGREYAQRIKAVTLTDIQIAAKKYFSDSNRAWIELIPQEKTEKDAS
jgi:zinc protease